MKKLLMIAGMVLAAKLTTQACDCVSPPVDKAFEKAAAVFAGTVQEVRDDRQSGVKIVTLTVEQAWKGLAADQKTVTVQTASSGKACGYEFQEKINYLVYAYGESKSLRTDECSRTCPLANAEEDLVFLTGDAATAKKIRTTAVPLPAAVRTQATDWAQANGKADWGAITRVVDHEDRWAVLFTKILAQGTKVEHPAGVWIMKDTGNISELRGE